MAINGLLSAKSYGRSLNRRLSAIDSRMTNLYNTTYATRSDNKEDLERITGDIEGTLASIIGNNAVERLSDVSNLFVRLQKKKGVSNDQLVNGAMELFNNNNIIGTLSATTDIMKGIQAENYQYDMICKYMSKLEDALNIKKDNILSSDNFSKEFMSVKSDKYSDRDSAFFFQRTKTIINKYRLSDLFDKMVYQAEKYGEVFLYVVPYDVAIQRLMDRKENSPGMKSTLYRGFSESFTLEGTEVADSIDSNIKNHINITENSRTEVHFSPNPILEKYVQAVEKANTIMESVREQSLTEAYNVLSEASDANIEGQSFDSVYDKKSIKKSMNSVASDGLIFPNKDKYEKVKNLSGAVVEILPRETVIPVYMTSNLCIGYYVFDITTDEICPVCDGGANPINMMSHTFSNSNLQDEGIDAMIRQIAQQISDQIDTRFINANKDLKEEIYAILRYNDKFNVINGVNNINVSFIPADDIEHFYFELNDRTHRGVSDLKKSLVPAMLYSLLYLTNTIGEVTRAQDKRIYYVKQNVETNVAKTMLNVINQLKKGNMGMRQISSMNNILNIVGRYNDHVIPLGPSGDPPVQFEVMNGQDIKTPTELMERFEDSAVSSTDVPLEFVQTVNQVDYATRFTMSNSKFLRMIFKRQRICQDCFSRIFTKIYNYEYGENESKIRVLLPAPAFLTLTNTQQLVSNMNSYVDAIIENDCANESDEVKGILKKKLSRAYLGSYIDYEQIDNLLAISRLEAKVNGEDENE